MRVGAGSCVLSSIMAGLSHVLLNGSKSHPATVSGWIRWHRAATGLADRSSRRHHGPDRLSAPTERRIIALRFNRRWGPRRIGYHLHLPRSTVGRVLARYRMLKLECIDQVTGPPVPRPGPCRDEADCPGQLVHVDVKMLGRIPGGGRWRAHGRGSVQDRKVHSSRGKAARAGQSSSRRYRYLHHGRG